MIDRGRDERELVRRCREGSEAAYAELVRRHSPRLYTLAYRLTNDREAAEDVVQETFLAAFKSIERVEPRPSLVPWLNTITIRVAGRAAARRTAQPRTSLDQLVDRDGPGRAPPGEFVTFDETSDPHSAAEGAELRRELSDAISQLPFNYRAAVVLRYVMGLDYAESARALDVPMNTFKSHLLRGTRMLRERLAGRLEAGPDAVASVEGIPLRPPAVEGASRRAKPSGEQSESRDAGAFADPAAMASERTGRS